MTKKEMIVMLRKLHDPAKHQEVIDEIHLTCDERFKRPRRLDSCGHYNCQYHGLCAVVEMSNILRMELEYLADFDVEEQDQYVLGSAGKYQGRSDLRPFHSGSLCFERGAHTGQSCTVLA